MTLEINNQQLTKLWIEIDISIFPFFPLTQLEALYCQRLHLEHTISMEKIQ